MGLAESHLDVPYEQRWELLKPTIVNIYLEERATLAQLSKRMVDEFRFKAEIHQYRYRLKSWGIKKRTTRAEKKAVITILGKRSRQHDVGTSDVQLEQVDLLKPVGKKQLLRYIINTLAILTQRSLYIHPGSLYWNLPYFARYHDCPLPLRSGPQTSAYHTVSSPQEGTSLMTQLAHKKVLMDRAQLLVGCQDLDLMKQWSRDERRATANWLHDFWVFSFVTTKFWGKGPKNWNLLLINFKTLAGAIHHSLEDHPVRSQKLNITQFPFMATGVIDPPTQLCNWSVHIDYHAVDWGSIDSYPSSPGSEYGDRFDIVEDASTWKEWDDQYHRDLASTISEGLQTNTFTTQRPEDLPLAISHMVKTASGSMNLEVEAIGFAIMARKVVALFEILEKEDFSREALRVVSPFHMAAKFLDGSKGCCTVMWELLVHLDNELSVGMNYTDDTGLTILDTLFMTILRSHSSITPSVLETTFSVPRSMFEGVDVDICGRWDADSPCVRALHAAGEATIPNEWKHMFCHTSAQAVCHCLTVIFMEIWRPNINTPSGLFRKRCRSCGLELKLGPLHAFVLVCFHLAWACRPEETLFGMLACLVCLLTLRADPSSTAEISLPAIFKIGETEECQHQPFNAAELASAVPSSIVNAWTPEVKLGWQAIKEVLKHSVGRGQVRANMTDVSANLSVNPQGVLHNYDEGNEEGSGSERDNESCRHNIHLVESEDKMKYVKCGDKRLGTIWAAIQVELLTYRRLEVGDPWLSSMFDMHDVAKGLRASNDSILMRLVENRGKETLRGFSTCGLFLEVDNPGCARREEACVSSTNLEDSERTMLIQGRASFWTRLVASS